MGRLRSLLARLFGDSQTPMSPNLRWSILGLICLAAVLSHLPLLFGSFVEYDDGSHIFRNPIIQDLTWKNFQETLFTNFMGRASSPSFALHILNWAIGDGAYSAFAAVNLAWLVVATLIFYRFTALFLGGDRSRLFATALFAVHSVNVDTIAWMSARCHFFGATYVMVAMIFWQLYLDDVKQWRRFLFFVLAFLSACMAMWSKGLFVVTGPLICVYDLYRRRRMTPLLVIDKIPFALVALVPFMHPPITVTPDAFARPSIGPTLTDTLLNDSTLFVEYLRRGIVPGPTTIDATVYSQIGLFGVASSDTIWMAAMPPIFNIGVLLLIFTVAFWAMRRYHLKQPFYALLFVTVSLLPVMNIPPRWVEFAFRFIFLPSIFLSVAIAALLSFAWTRISGRAGRAVLIAVALGFFSWHFAQSVVNSSAWRTNSKYWITCLENFPDSITCHLKRALDHSDNGRKEEAIAQYKKMLNYTTTFNPKRDHQPAYHTAREYSRLGDVENACYYYRYAQLRESLNAGYRNNARQYISKNCKDE